MGRVWVADASPVIVLAKVGRLNLLTALADELLLPEPVAAELMAGPADDPARLAVAAGWATRVRVDDLPTAIVEWGLGPGESAVLAAGLRRPGAVAILDDAEARACARTVGVRVSGTLGVVVRAHRAGLVDALPAAIDDLRRAGLYLDDALVEAVLRRSGW